VNDVGEPCAGEPHARFEVAAGGNHGQSGQHAPCGRASLPPTLQIGQPRAEENVPTRHDFRTSDESKVSAGAGVALRLVPNGSEIPDGRHFP
jgi:1,6-anhydro-N-acetylmuramate kinase